MGWWSGSEEETCRCTLIKMIKPGVEFKILDKISISILTEPQLPSEGQRSQDATVAEMIVTPPAASSLNLKGTRSNSRMRTSKILLQPVTRVLSKTQKKKIFH